MSKKEKYKRIARRTAGGTSAMVASKSQMRPLRTEIRITEFGSITAGENCHAYLLSEDASQTKGTACIEAARRRRSKPTSMMTSNPMSVESETRTVGLVVSMLRMRQALASIDHVERIYGCQVSLTGPKQSN
jgi:hypothetical protein